MANVTITVDVEVLRRARIRALEQGTSINAILRDYLTSYAGEDVARRGLRELLEMARSSSSRSGALGRTWTRDELHDR